MDKNMQIYEMLPGNLCADSSWRQAKNTRLRCNEPYYVTVFGETFYTGNEGKTVEKKTRGGFFSRIFRRNTRKKERTGVWKKIIA